MSYVSVGVMYWYISVVFGILLEVGDLELGMGCLYYLFAYLYGIHMDQHVISLSALSSMAKVNYGDHIFPPLLYPM